MISDIGEARAAGPRLVVCAAMLMMDDHIMTGVRHFSPEMRETMRRIYGPEYHKQVRLQGFIDQHGVFMNRLTAWEVANAAGQIRYEVSKPGLLYSENLY